MGNRADVAVVGGGIVGLAFAWEAARRGKSVVLFERQGLAQGASVRNFGMVWPIGQRPGADYQLAMRSRERWLELRDLAGIPARECGSIHAVYEDDENAVLREFAEMASTNGIACEYVEPADALRRFPSLQPYSRSHALRGNASPDAPRPLDHNGRRAAEEHSHAERGNEKLGLKGVLFSPTELCVDPRQVIATIPGLLKEKYGVTLRYGTAVTGIEMPRVTAANGETWTVERAFVCAGADFETLFPKEYAATGIVRCKLQMMRTNPQPNGWQLGPHFAGGLTLGHYKSFEACPSLAAMKRRHAEQYPLHTKFGIHVMASQNHLGEVVIGDSHEYGPDPSPFDQREIDDLILEYLRGMLRMPDETIAARWHGVYAKHPTQVYCTAEPQPNCRIVTSPGGAGMTLSFGIARQWWDTMVS